MIVVLVICFGAMAYMLLGQDAVVEFDDINTEDLLSQDFMQVRKVNKVDDILESLSLEFIDYDIYKRMKGGISLPEVSDSDIGNNSPFHVQELIQ